MARLPAFLVVAAASLAAGIAHAQTPVQISGGGLDVDILADRMEERGPELMIATGNVEISRGSTRLSADRVELNRPTGDAVATGHVVFYDGQDQLTGERLDYNLKNGTGVVYNARAFSAPYYRLSGERMERLDESLYKIYRGVLTTCEDDPPLWSVHFGSGTVDFDDYVFGENASFWVRKVPVVPFIPVFAAALRRERQTGFLPPTFGNSTLKGYFAKVPFFWAISDSQDATIALDAYSTRGVGANAEYRYILSGRAQGTATGFFVDETELRDDVRGYFKLAHNWTIGPGLSFKADINHASDDDLFREYGDRLFERSLQRTDSNVFITKSWQQWNFVGNFFWYQDLTTPRSVELQRLPDLRLTSVRQPVPGVPRALWEFESSAVHFVREVGSEGSRLDLHPRALIPVRPYGSLTFTPFVGVRATTYDQRVVGSKTVYREDRVVELTTDAVRTRVLGETGTDFEARASRIYDVKAAGIAQVSHQIEPRVNYTFTDGVAKDKLPQWDGIDTLARRNAFTYSLTNRLLAKTIAGPDERPVKWELARFLVSHTFDADASTRPFSDITGDLIIDPNRYFRFRADAAYSVYAGNALRSVNSDIGLQLQDITATIGTRWNKSANISFVRGEAGARLSRYLALRGSSDCDAEKGVFVENRVGADLHFQCWALALTYINRAGPSIASGTQTPRADHEFRFSVDLLGIGAVGTQAGFGP